MRKADVRDEIIRCGREPIYFINKYVKIRHPVRGLIPFKTFAYQDAAINSFITRRFNIVLKSRQMGYTEIVSAFIVWLILFHRDQSVMVISTKSETAKNVIRRVKTAIKNIPNVLIPTDITTDNKTSVELSNGSWVKSVAKSIDAGRSEALSLLVIDEAAHVEGLEDIWTGLKPTVSEGGFITMMSTPNGINNTFYKLYVDAQSGKNDFNHIRTDWWEHPEHIADLSFDQEGAYTSSWFKKETRGLSRRQIAQEYLCEFLSSGDTFFDPELIAAVNGNIRTPARIGGTESFDGVGLHTFFEPKSGGRYIMGADTATGHGHDSSAFHVFDIDTMQQAAEYNGKLKPDEFGDLANEIGLKYNRALIAAENNAVGIAFIQQLRQLSYPNMFYSRKGVVAEGQASPTVYAPNAHYVAGVTTLGNNRSLMLNKLEELIREGKVQFFSSRFHAEMQSFVWHNDRPEARGAMSDDLIMAAAFAVWVREILYGKQYNTPEFYKSMIAAIHVDRKSIQQIPGASKSPDLVPARLMGAFNVSRPQNPYVMRLPNGQYIDFADMVGMGAMVPKKG